MAYILGEDQLRLRVKPVILIILLNVVNDGDGGKHAHKVAVGVEHLRDKQPTLTRWGHDVRTARSFSVKLTGQFSASGQRPDWMLPVSRAESEGGDQNLGPISKMKLLG